MKLNYITMALVSVAVVILVIDFWHPPWTALRIVGLSIALLSCVLLGIARVQLGGAFSIRPKATTLVTTGLYSRIRNPIYVFACPTLMGFALWAMKPWFLLALLIIIPLQIYRSRKEEQVLTEKFGAAYLEYKRSAWF